MEILDTAIVGAGPYGLSVAAHARARGVRTRVFGTPMEAWAAHMPVGMRLKTEPWVSHLSDPSGRYTLDAYCQLKGLTYPQGVPVPVQTFVDYGLWFRQETAPDLHDIRVARVRRDGTLFALELHNEHIVRTRSVVLASGFLPYARVPGVLAEIDYPYLLHSSDLHDLSGFFGLRVAVVGGGQSAIETAVLLRQQGAHVTLVVRAPRLKWNDFPDALGESWYRRIRHPETGLGRGWRNKAWADAPGLFRRLPEDRRAHIMRNTLAPAGSWWLREPFAKAFNEHTVRTATEIVAAKQDRSRVLLDLRGPRGLYGMEVDHVVAATGYEVDVRRLTVLDEPLRTAVHGLAGASGPPTLGASFDTSVPGLHVVGLAAAATFGPAMRFVFGCGFTARRVVRALPR